MATSEQRLTIEPGAANVIGESLGGQLEILPLSVEQYDRMIEEGILPEDTTVELLDGILVRKDRGDAGGDPMTVGDMHAYVVRQLAYLGLRLDPISAHIQTQQPITIVEAGGEPEPDAAIVSRPLTTVEKPRAKDVSCVIEVAGTSLRRDRTTKLRHYARGGIPQYVILVLADRTAEEYLDPDRTSGTYGRRVVHSPDATLALRLAGDATLPVSLAGLFPRD
ncbi:MAG TPA: Uma2 family endonuclease [Thermoanaerobaculia bacterium]|jgi:Uma2 family endonuclease|nr:Uma2 family endonuclease [Thermoanaerobaculia bacterium]